MNTLEEFYKKMLDCVEIQEELIKALQDGNVNAFVDHHNLKSSGEALLSFLNEKDDLPQKIQAAVNSAKKLEDEELDDVVGGREAYGNRYRRDPFNGI